VSHSTPGVSLTGSYQNSNPMNSLIL
jgi:hypothetical protein